MSCLMSNYEPMETNFIRNHLKSGFTFIDIGANIGWHTLLAAEIVGNSGKVFSFEPRQLSRQLLLKSLADNNFEDRVKVYDCGLSDSKKEAVLRWALDGINPGGATLDDTVNNIDHASEIIELDILDNYQFDRLDLIKIDIEGAELSAMRGAIKTIKKHRPVILSEIISEQLKRVSGGDETDYLNFMHALGYICYELVGNSSLRVVTSEKLFRNSSIVNVAFISR